MSSLADVGAGVFVTGAFGIVGVLGLRVVRGGLELGGRELHTRARARQAEAAVTEASFEAEWFDPEEIDGAVEEMLALAYSVWLGSDPEASWRADRGLIERWARSVIVALGEGARPVGKPAVDILQVINRTGEDEDRIELRIRLKFRQAQHRFGEPHTVAAHFHWTLGRVNRAWRLLSVDNDPLTDQGFDRPFIVAEWADEERLREQAMRELADADALSPDVDLAELISPDLPVRRQLAELAVMDGRYDLGLLGVSIAHIVQAWEEACAGSPKPLASLTSPEAFDALLHSPSGGQGRRLVIRDAVVDGWNLTALHFEVTPPEIAISLTVSASRFIVKNVDGRRAVGSADARQLFALTWTLALTDSKPAAWALASSTDPAGVRAALPSAKKRGPRRHL